MSAQLAGSLQLGEAEGRLDYDRPQSGRLPVRYGLLRPFQHGRPTIFVVADGQQFYVTPEAFGPTVAPIFSDLFNVVGVFARADAPSVQAQVGSGDSTDWPRAYQLLRADQWIGDLEAVRRALVGEETPVLLYGRSGGGLLVHQYVAAHPRRASGVFTQAAVNHFLEAEFGLRSDRFWDELSAADQQAISAVIAAGRLPRPRVAALFQRQNFFVDRQSLAAGRHDLIAALVDGRTDAIEGPSPSTRSAPWPS